MANGFLLINVLPQINFQDCHIPGSIHIAMADLEREAAKLDKNQEIIVYCASYECPLSRKAWHLLHDLGFTNIRAYEGGMREWSQLGFPVEGGCKGEYLKAPNKRAEHGDKDVKTVSAQEVQERLKSIPVK